MDFNLITNPRRAGWLVRAFGMKISGSPAPTLAPEVAPSIEVNQQDDPTLRFLRGEKIMGCSVFFAASVGNINRMQLRNPANSGVLLVITAFTNGMTGTNQAQVGVGVLTAELAGGSVVPQPRDGRWLQVGGSRSTSIGSWDQTAAPAIGVQYISFSPENRKIELVCPPGTGASIVGNSANQTGWWAFEFYERPVAAEELQTG